MRTMNHILFRTAKLLRWPALWLVSVVLVLVLGTTVSAQEHTDKQKVARQFPAERGTSLEVVNKYGTIQVVTWEKDSVAVEVDILLTESSASKLRKLKDEINIDFARTNSFISAKTRIKSESGRIASELKSVSHAISGSNKHMEIEYMVYVPDYMELTLTNKFGDIYMDDLKGKVEIDLSNGALKASRLEGNSNIALSFANGMIKSLGSSSLKLLYSDMTVGDVGQLDLESKSSILHADSINVLKIDSRRDKLYFQQVEYLYGNGNFSQVWIYDFLRESDVTMKYGKLTIEHVVPEFSKIYVESDYTDITLMFDNRSAFAFDILHHERSVLRLPDTQVMAEESFDGKEHYRTTGTLGGGEPGRQVTINALQKCFINLSIK